MSGSVADLTECVGERIAPTVESDTALADAGNNLVRSKEWTGGHPVNLRLSIRLPGGRFYVTLVAGSERRATQRRAAESLKHPLATAGNILAIGVTTAVISFASLAFFEYLTIWALRAMTLVSGTI